MRAVRFRTDVGRGEETVIGRYSVLPFYKELSDELRTHGSHLINSHGQHSFVADVMAWAGPGGCLEGLTPRTWTEWHSLPIGQYVVKGRTNSRKHRWDTHMFAPTRENVATVVRRLSEDTMIADQGFVVREYVPLRRFDTGINGLPITNEWRTFWIVGKDGKPVMLAKGFYWSSSPELISVATWDAKAEAVVNKAAEKVADFVNFFVLDVAETEAGDWIVIEVNDGQMSGLSEVDPDELYRNLAYQLREE